MCTSSNEQIRFFFLNVKINWNNLFSKCWFVKWKYCVQWKKKNVVCVWNINKVVWEQWVALRFDSNRIVMAAIPNTIFSGLNSIMNIDLYI